MKIFIYKTINLINNKIYIGQHCDSKTFKSYYGSGIKINRIIKKYGIKKLRKEILFTAYNRTQADLIEKYYIKKYNSINRKIGYNISEGGFCHGKLSEETKNKIRNKLKGTKLSEETKNKISLIMKGRKLSDEHRRNLSKALVGNKNAINWSIKKAS